MRFWIFLFTSLSPARGSGLGDMGAQTESSALAPGGHPHGTFGLKQPCVAELAARPPWKARALFQTQELFTTLRHGLIPAGTRTSTSCDLEPGPPAGSGGDTLVQLTPSSSPLSRGWAAPAIVRATAAVLQFLLAIKFCTEPQRQCHVLPAQMLS